LLVQSLHEITHTVKQANWWVKDIIPLKSVSKSAGCFRSYMRKSDSNRQQQPFNFLESRLGFFFGEAREFAAERDEIVVARDF
jgi:hypothetical protein